MLEPVLKNSQVNVLNLQGEVVVIVYVNGAVPIVQVVIVLDPTYGPSQGCEPMGGQACSFTILLGFLEILHDPWYPLRLANRHRMQAYLDTSKKPEGKSDKNPQGIFCKILKA